MSHSDGKTVGEQAFVYIAVTSENSSTPIKQSFPRSRVHTHLPFDPAIPFVEIYSEDTLPQRQNNAQKVIYCHIVCNGKTFNNLNVYL